MSTYVKKFRPYLRRNETARGLFLVGLVILGAIAIWGGIRLALNTEYPSALKVGDIVVFRGSQTDPNYLIIHRIIILYTPSSDTAYPGQYAFVTHGDANPPGANEGPNPVSTLVGVYQSTIPIPYIGSAILGIRGFMYDDKTGQPTFRGILVIAALILALFVFEVAEPGKKNSSSNVQEKAKTSAALANVWASVRPLRLIRVRGPIFLAETGLA